MKTQIIMAALFLVLVGCTTTRDLWKQPTYKEKITGFYWADKENQLIGTGDKYAYATTVDEELKRAINLHQTIDMRMGLFDTELDRKNNFTTTLTLYTNKKEHELTKSELSMLNDAGFAAKRSVHGLSLTKSLIGTRYLLEGTPKKSSFEKPYVVKIKEPQTYAGTAGKMVATPFALTYDTFVVAPMVLMVLTVMAFDSYGAGD